MNKTYTIWGIMAIGALTLSASAATVWLENGGKNKLTTGDQLDKIKNIEVTAQIVEIPDLSITVKTVSENLEINALSDSLGIIDTTNPTDDRSCFQKDEALILYFNKSVHLSGIDFNHFDAAESFTLRIGENQHIITYTSLANKTSDLFKCDLNIPAGTKVQLNTSNDASVIGLDALEIEVVEEKEVANSADQNESIDPLQINK